MAFVKRNVRWQPILVVLLVSALLLVALDQRGSGPITAVRRVAREVISPFQTGVNSVFNPVRDLFDGVINYGQLRDRNLDLKRKNEVLQGKLLRERAVGSKVGELEKLLDLPTFEDATGVAARVVGGSPSNFERTVSINKGTSSGIQVGQPVVAGAGLVGKVTAVSRTVSTVTLINSSGFGVGVRLENSNEQGIAEGKSGENQMKLSFLTDVKIVVKKGELTFTSATTDAVFPPDIPVARVVSSQKLAGALEPTVILEPVVNLDDLTYVKVLR